MVPLVQGDPIFPSIRTFKKSGRGDDVNNFRIIRMKRQHSDVRVLKPVVHLNPSGSAIGAFIQARPAGAQVEDVWIFWVNRKLVQRVATDALVDLGPTLSLIGALEDTDAVGRQG